ncbi:MAG: IspD/TarI family cytidylyltransferase [Acidimicrobiales bacterium]
MGSASKVVWVVVVAGGSGTRFGGLKQLARLGDRRVIDWSMEVAGSVGEGVVLVLPQAEIGVVPGSGWPVHSVVGGGTTRSDSVRCGLEAVPERAEVIVVHDGARPLASQALFHSVLAGLDDQDLDAVLPGVAVTETLKRVVGSRVACTVDRSDLVTVQTPQAFRAGSLRRAHEQAPQATDDAALVEMGGGVIGVVLGETSNIKLTTPEDLVLAEKLIGP